MRTVQTKTTIIRREVIRVSGTYTTSTWDPGISFEGSDRPITTGGLTGPEARELVMRAYEEGRTTKYKYYVPGTGRVTLRVIDHKDSPMITGHQMFHQFDTYKYDGIQRTKTVEVIVTMGLAKTKRDLLGKKDATEMYFKDLPPKSL